MVKALLCCVENYEIEYGSFKKEHKRKMTFQFNASVKTFDKVSNFIPFHSLENWESPETDNVFGLSRKHFHFSTCLLNVDPSLMDYVLDVTSKTYISVQNFVLVPFLKVFRAYKYSAIKEAALCHDFQFPPPCCPVSTENFFANTK